MCLMQIPYEFGGIHSGGRFISWNSLPVDFCGNKMEMNCGGWFNKCGLFRMCLWSVHKPNKCLTSQMARRIYSWGLIEVSWSHKSIWHPNSWPLLVASPDLAHRRMDRCVLYLTIVRLQNIISHNHRFLFWKITAHEYKS